MRTIQIFDNVQSPKIEQDVDPAPSSSTRPATWHKQPAAEGSQHSDDGDDRCTIFLEHHYHRFVRHALSENDIKLFRRCVID